MLRQRADREVPDDPESALIDHVDRVAVAVRNVDVRTRAPRHRAEVPGPVGRVDVSHCDLSRPSSFRRRDQLCQVGHRSRCIASAGDQDPTSVCDGGKVGAGPVEPAHDSNAAGRKADRDDAVGRRSHRAASSPDHEGKRADGGGRGVRCLRGKRAEPDDVPRRGDVLVDRVTGGAGLERSPGDDDPVANGRDRRVAQRVRETRDDARGAAGPPGDDRVQPASAGISADDVRRPTDGRGGLVRAASRQVPGRLRCAGARVDHQDRVELRGGGSAAEQVDRATDLDRRRIV